MGELTARRIVGILTVSLLVLLAGCSGGGGGGGGANTTDGGAGTNATTAADATDASEPTKTETAVAATETAADRTDGDDGGDGDDSTPTEGTTATTPPETSDPPETSTPPSTTTLEPNRNLPTYEFAEGESYTYNLSIGTTNSSLKWEVTSVEGDQVTVEISSQTRGNDQSSTVTASQERIVVKSSTASSITLFPALRVPLGIATMGEMSAGNTFTIRSSNLSTPGEVQWDTATVEVLGETTVNGVECTEFELRPEGVDQVLTSCVAEGYPFAISLTSSQNGRTVFVVELVDSNRP